MSLEVRRITAAEWPAVRTMRLEALQDPVASIAFLDTFESASAQPDEFWQERAQICAEGSHAAQFVALEGAEWVGTATVLRPEPGEVEVHSGGLLTAPRSKIVAVFVPRAHRGKGVISALLVTAERWAASQGDIEIALNVHVDNARALAAYRREGYSLTGVEHVDVAGREYEMVRELTQDATPPRILLVNGPNLNLLGTREPDVYGTATLADIEALVADEAERLGFEVRAVQSNHEGALIDAIHAAREDCAAIVVNPGGLTHTSVVLRDALTGVALPFAEVHISDVYAREEFRHFSYLTDVAAVHVVGQGIEGYRTAVRQLSALIT